MRLWLPLEYENCNSKYIFSYFSVDTYLDKVVEENKIFLSEILWLFSELCKCHHLSCFYYRVIQEKKPNGMVNVPSLNQLDLKHGIRIEKEELPVQFTFSGAPHKNHSFLVLLLLESKREKEKWNIHSGFLITVIRITESILFLCSFWKQGDSRSSKLLKLWA